MPPSALTIKPSHAAAASHPPPPRTPNEAEANITSALIRDFLMATQTR